LEFRKTDCRSVLFTENESSWVKAVNPFVISKLIERRHARSIPRNVGVSHAHAQFVNHARLVFRLLIFHSHQVAQWADWYEGIADRG
jgi:hypothetical protein